MSLVTQLQTLTTRVATEFKTIRTVITGSGTGDLSTLTTTDKTSIIAAINEVQSEAGGGPPDATDTVKGVVELATPGETVTGTDAGRATTPAGVRAALDALVDGAPGALDTLNELAAAVGDNADFAGSVTTSLSNKQPLDADLTAIAALTSAADKVPYATGAGTWSLADFTAAGRTLVGGANAAAQRTSLSVYSTADIGDPATDFVATFEAGLL